MSSKGQVVIPKEIRDKLKLTPRDRLQIYEQEGKIIIENILDAEEDPWDDMEFLDIQGDEDALVRAAMGNMAKKHVTDS